MANVHNENLMDLFLDYFKGNYKPLLAYLAKNGFQAAVDFPMCAICIDLLNHFPDAKVLLTVRDTPEAWVKFGFT